MPIGSMLDNYMFLLVPPLLLKPAAGWPATRLPAAGWLFPMLHCGCAEA